MVGEVVDEANPFVLGSLDEVVGVEGASVFVVGGEGDWVGEQHLGKEVGAAEPVIGVPEISFSAVDDAVDVGGFHSFHVLNDFVGAGQVVAIDMGGGSEEGLIGGKVDDPVERFSIKSSSTCALGQQLSHRLVNRQGVG